MRVDLACTSVDRVWLPQMLQWYYFDEFGQGVAIDFSFKLKTKVAFHSKCFIANKGGSLRKGPLIPSGKIVVIINWKACSQNVIT